MNLCDWRDWDADCADLVASVTAGKPATQPFVFLAVPSSPADQLQCAGIWTAQHFRLNHRVGAGEAYRHRPDSRRLSVGGFPSARAVGADGGDVRALTIGRVSRYRGLLVAGADDKSPMRKRMMAAFEHFIDAHALDDDAVADLLRAREIDIAVDLMGFTHDSRTGIFARRPAPVQVTIWAFPARWARPISIMSSPTGRHSGRRAADLLREGRLPARTAISSNDRQRPHRRTRAFTRAELGLPDAGSSSAASTTATRSRPTSSIAGCGSSRASTAACCGCSGINPARQAICGRGRTRAASQPTRLVFAPRLRRPEHLARHRLADLFLDTLPYNAHTTASDALWAGLPVLTRIGETFAGRVAASLLGAIGLPELITETSADYERRAIALAGDAGAPCRDPGQARAKPPHHAAVRHRLFTRHMEAAFDGDASAASGR